MKGLFLALRLPTRQPRWPQAGVVVLAALIAGCSTVPELAGVVPAPTPPVLAHECWADNPPEPALPGEFGRLDERAKEREALRIIEAKKADRAQLAAWRMTCRASLKAQFGAPPRVKTSERPSS